MMTRARFLTVRWNNLLSVALGLPTLGYVVLAFSTAIWPLGTGLIGLSFFGALF
jgi:hypothetical protein